jgi:hypothetical protein
MDVPEVRRRVRAAIEGAKREAVSRRERSDTASRDYAEFLTARAVPIFHQLAAALVGEGHRFKVVTPAGSVRLASERSAEDFVELTLDTTVDPPAVLGRTSFNRGRRAITSERPVRDGAPIPDLTESDVLDFVLSELTAFL